MAYIKQQRLLLVLGVTIGLLFFGIIFWNLRSESTITPPPEYPDANLRVDVQIELPTDLINSHIVIDAAGLACPVFDMESEEGLPVWLKGSRPWCDVKALNLPVETDANGQAILWFKVAPPPYKAGIGEVVGDPTTPSVLFSSAKRRVNTEMPVVITSDHWRVHGTLR